jgi:hypothetical protein
MEHQLDATITVFIDLQDQLNLPTASTGQYTICCKKNLSLALLKMGKSLPETC